MVCAVPDGVPHEVVVRVGWVPADPEAEGAAPEALSRFGEVLEL